MLASFTPPEPVSQVLSRLTASGFEAYLVGGCVRDLLLHREPADWDICTSAHPNAVRALFPGALETGLRHGTITAMMAWSDAAKKSRLPVEITTFRSESQYADHRHPEIIRFCSDLQTDLARRDFTINAMAWSPASGLVDLFGGQLDLADHLVRCVGDPLQRLAEDALRMLRAIRFCSQLGFSLDPDTKQAIRHHRNDLLHVSMERVQYEMTRTLTGQQPSKAILWWETGLHALLFDLLLPDDAQGVMPLAPMPDTALPAALRILDFTPGVPAAADQSASGIDVTPSPAATAWALLLCATGFASQPDALSGWMRCFRFPNALALEVRQLISLIEAPMPQTCRNIRLMVSQSGPARAAVVCRLRNALAAQSDTIAEETLPAGELGFPEPIPLPDGHLIQKWLNTGWQPKGRSFGAFLACLRIARCEQPMLASGAWDNNRDPFWVRAMRNAAQTLNAAHDSSAGVPSGTGFAKGPTDAARE